MAEDKKFKKRNMIISIVCVFVILCGVITSIILATRKHFTMEYDYQPNYNGHTSMIMLDYDKSLLQPI